MRSANRRAGAAASGTQRTARGARAIAEAQRLFDAGDDSAVIKALQPFTGTTKPDPDALFILGTVAERQHRLQDAADLARRALAIQERPNPLLLLARTTRRLGLTDECVSTCDRILTQARGLGGSHHPYERPASAIKAGALEEAGRYDDAERVLTPFIERAERTGEPLAVPFQEVHAKLHIHRKRYPEAIDATDQILSDDRIGPDVRRSVLYVKAKAHDRAKQYDDAFEAARAANTIDELEFDPELYEAQVTALIENWSAERLERFPLASEESELPVFVAGMPRSGTSLIDQIIDAHPKASGVGELNTIERFAAHLAAAYDPEKEPPACFGRCDRFRWTRAAREYVKEITAAAPGGAERVVNKALGNNKLVGLLARLFPKTRIIHAIRDPRDVAVSCFMGGFNNRLHPWTTRVEWVAGAWAQSIRMMEHWKRTLDVPILDVYYERLVADPENEFPRIIDFLGLEWDDRCFEFHTTRRTVRTLSYDQVNRPLYTSSVSRWKRYESHLGHVGPWPTSTA